MQPLGDKTPVAPLAYGPAVSCCSLITSMTGNDWSIERFQIDMVSCSRCPALPVSSSHIACIDTAINNIAYAVKTSQARVVAQVVVRSAAVGDLQLRRYAVPVCAGRVAKSATAHRIPHEQTAIRLRRHVGILKIFYSPYKC